MYYLDKLLEIAIVLLFNAAFFVLGHSIYHLFSKNREITMSRVLLYFGIGSGCFGMALFFFGAVFGLSSTLLYIFLSVFFVISILIFARSRKDFSLFWKHLNVKDLSSLEKSLLVFLLIVILYNLYRGFWPDVDFDSIWYHLTEPKIYLMNEKISFIKGGLLYYSAMPQLIETFYLLGLFLKSGITAKLFHTFFGIWCALLAYVWGKDLGKSKFAGLMSSLLFYVANIVIWESQNAYIDLGVTFFVSLGLWQFVSSLKKGSRTSKLILSSVFIGFALGSKLLSIYWVFILLVANLFWLIISKSFNFKKLVIESLIIGGIPLLMWLPWGFYSYISTNNPVYPLAEGLFNDNDWFSSTQMEGLSTKAWLIDRFKKLVQFPSTILQNEYGFNPILIYGFLFSILSLLHKKSTKIVGIIFLTFLMFWSFTPASGDRFFLPITILMAVYAGYFIFKLVNKSTGFKTIVVTLIVSAFFFIQIFHSYYQAKPNFWIYSKSSEEDYLKTTVSQNMWSFYDYNGDVSKIVGDSKVLTYNIHNLFYLDFQFDDTSFIKDDLQTLDNPEEFLYTNYDYLLLKRSTPESFLSEIGIFEMNLNLVYEDTFSEIQIYEIFE